LGRRVCPQDDAGEAYGRIWGENLVVEGIWIGYWEEEGVDSAEGLDVVLLRERDGCLLRKRRCANRYNLEL
jgi:hypothetical protein